MNIFVSTLIKLPQIVHNDITKIFAADRVNESFCTDLKKDPKNKRRPFNNCYDGDSSVEEVRTKGGQLKILASDCRVATNANQKVNCWYCRARPGFEKNGLPVHIEELKNEEDDQCNVGKWGYFCDDYCMYAFAKERCIPGAPYYQLYKNGMKNAEFLYKCKYPDKGCIEAAQSWELLKCNGGSLDYDMWKNECLEFQKLPGFNFTQVSNSYLQK
jgi:hypothetical protein